MGRHHHQHPAGGRGAFHGPPRHAPHAPYAPPHPPLPPHGGAVPGGFVSAPLPHQFHGHAPPPPGHGDRGGRSGGRRDDHTATLERDVASFVNSLRASRSDAAAPPNALHVRDVVPAICAQFGTAAYDALSHGATTPTQLPPLRAIQTQHERVWSFVTCYQHARRLHTLFECHQAFLQHEGIQHFRELGIGTSFLHTDAVQSLYHAPASIYRLTTADVLTAFRHYESVMGHDAFSQSNAHHAQARAPPQRIDREQFKQFLAQQRRQPSAEAMGLFIAPDGFGPYIAMLRRIAKKEQREIHELQEEFNKGIADRVFELSKEKFSAENRQLALAALLQRTTDERVTELSRSDPTLASSSGRRGNATAKATTTLSSLSLDILNRVTDVDVYLDNMLRRKSADERYKSRLASHAIADTDQKIRTQLTPFLLATQKSRHHARVKVVTWVLCGVLAKIHTLLQLDDKIPDAKLSNETGTDDKATSRDNDKENDDEGEECDCCCVGEDTCRCRCQCECHQDESDDDETPKSDTSTKKTDPADKTSEHEAPAKRKRSRSRSDSVAVPVEDVKAALERFLAEQLSVVDDATNSTESAVKLLARAEAHLRTTFVGSVGSVSLLEEVAKELEAADVGSQGESAERTALQQIAECIRRGQAPSSSGDFVSSSSVTKDELRDFVVDCFQALSNEPHSDVVEKAVFQRACRQFGLDQVDKATKTWVEAVIADTAKDGSTRSTDDSIIHYAGAYPLVNSSVGGCVNEATVTTELALLEDEASRDQVMATKTAEALAALAQCPYLTDVAEWTHWRARFAPFCGTLRTFLRSHEMIRVGDDHAVSAAEFVCCTNDQVMKIRASGDASASALDAVGMTSATLALELVSLFVQHRGSADDFPRELVLLHLRTMLKRVDGEDGEQEDANGRAAFVRDTVLSVPHDFVPFVWALLQAAVPSVDLEDEVSQCCQSRLERSRLQILGERFCPPKWRALADRHASQPLGREVVSATIRKSSSTKPAASGTSVISVSPSRVEPYHIDDAVSAPLVQLDASACQAFIHQLRREQFGIGLEIADADTRAVLQAQHRRLERALKRLSDELYSEKTHFVLELLQNADDNTYPRGVVPRGEFVLTRDGAIVFVNNETGFSERNIQAICDVGASTKEHEKGEHRSIGKKGIGFKSVFKVSDTPEVHSNGFHIQFHAKDEHVGRGLGYILPYWIDESARWKDAMGTTFVLPLNDHSRQRQKEISDSLLSFEPSVLLFLQKIRELRLTNDVTGGQLVYEKHEHVIETLSETSTTVSLATLQAERVKNNTSGEPVKTTQRWFIIRRQLAIPHAFAERGQHTDIAIAVPDLDHDDAQDTDDTTRPPLQQVFCYLPLRSYGFRFIVQGDFEVPSSREAISNGSDWNQWLISQYPALVPSLVGLVHAEKISLRSLLRVLPLDSDIQAPFRSIVADISREMRQLPCFPTADQSGLLNASELLDVSDFADDGAIDCLVHDAALVHGALQKRVLDLDVARAMPPLLKAQLRIERLRASHVLRLLTHAAPQHDVRLVLHLLQLLVKLSRHDRHRALLLQELRRIKCFPVRTGRVESWVSLSEISTGVLFIRPMRTARTASSSLFVDELSVLGDEVTSLLETDFPDTRRFLLEQLGIKELHDHDLALHHILPAIAKTPHNPSEAERLLWQARVTFLALHVARCGSTCTLRASIRSAMRAITWSGRVVDCQHTASLCVLVPAEAKRLESCAAWLRGRLAASGSDSVASFDVVALEAIAHNVESDALRTLWVDCCNLPELVDPLAPSANAVLSHVVQWIENEADDAVKRRVSTELVRVMDAAWSSSVPVRDDADAWWQRAAWLEGSDGGFYCSSELWIATPAVVALFSRSMVPVIKTAIESESLRAAWQLKTTPRVDDVVHVLQTLRTKAPEDLDVDVAHLTRLYAFLLEHSRSEEILTSAAIVRKAFVASPLIYVPANDDAERPARFVNVPSVVWSSGGSTVATVATALDTIYPKTLRAFFVGVCGVERKPTIEQLQQELQSQLAEATAMSKRKWTVHVLPVLQLLAKPLAKDKLSASQEKALKKTLKRLAWIPVPSDTDSRVHLCSMKRSHAHSVVAFAEDDADREIQRLCLSLDSSATSSDRVAAFVAVDDPDVLRELVPLLRLVGAVSVCESVRQRPAEWCRWLATLGAAATNDSAGNDADRRRSRKKYEKLLKKMLVVWANAWRDSETESRDEPASALPPIRSPAFMTELSTQSIFPSARRDHHALVRGVDLFVNDQHDLRSEQLEHPSLQLLSLFSWDHFVPTSNDSDDDASANVLALLLEAARVRSLAQHLHTEVVLLGAPQASADDAFVTAFRRALRVVQRVVFHQHASSYARLDHVELQQLLSSLRIQEIVGDARSLQLLHRVATTDVTLRQSVACYVDKPSQRVLVVTSSESPALLFDVLREVCRQCFGVAIATSVANVLYLASMQPTHEALETWLAHTQNVPPLDARAGATLWVPDDATVSAISRPRGKRERQLPTDAEAGGDTHEIEDGEVSDDDQDHDDHDHASATKRTKLYPWEQPSHQGASDKDRSWTHGPPPPPHHAAPGSGGDYYQHHTGPPPPRLSAGLASLAFSGGASAASTNGLSDDEKLAIGRWGEEYVYLQLQQSYAGRDDVTVEWVNEQDESGLPYDIVVKTGGSHDVEYVEVKSTKTMEKGVFEISMNELDQAAMHGSRYCIYRVFNAGNASLCRVVRMKNPIALVRQKKIALVLLMQ